MVAGLLAKKKSVEIGGDPWREFGERESAEVGEGGVGGGEVGGVVKRGRDGDCMGCVGGWREHRGGVGLDEEAVERDFSEEFAETGVARGEVGGVEGKIGAEGGERGDEFDGAAVGVKQETTRGKRDGAQRFKQKAEGIDAVNGGGAIQGDGEVELGFEDRELFVERCTPETGEARVIGAGTVKHPAVEADFADRGPGIGDEVSSKSFEPRGRTISDVPRVKPVGRQERNLRRAR